MKKKLRFSILEMMVVIVIILILMGMIMPILAKVRDKAKKTKSMAAAKSIGLLMIMYGEDDSKNNKMPYPLQKGTDLKAWGNSKECWSTSVAELMFKTRYMKKGEEGQLKSAGLTGADYEPMKLEDDKTKSSDHAYWNPETTLDYHLYCDKNLTSNVSGKFVLVISYDNDDIRNCQFNGDGWVAFFADNSTDFIQRAKYKEYKLEEDPPVISVDAVEGAITGTGVILRKDIAADKGGPGTFGANKGGGSTELIGKRDSDEVYKKLVK